MNSKHHPLILPDHINKDNTLMICIGNESRGDDGLGWAFHKAVNDTDHFRGESILRYQLQVEDAELISHYRSVIFVDAYDGELTGGYEWQLIQANDDFTYTTHALSPPAVLHLCSGLFDKQPNAFTLKIKGNSWQLGDALSPEAQSNLKQVIQFFYNKILSIHSERIREGAIKENIKS